MTQHDSSYHLLFSHPELVEDLLRNFVPEELIGQLNFSNMERVNTKFHADGLDNRNGDLIFRIHYNDGSGEIYLYLLLEFQSTPDKWMALRTMVYVGLLYQQLIKEKQLTEAQQLPPVFPLVLYNGDQAWTPSQDLQSLIALPTNSPLMQFQPQCRYYLVDESRYPEGKSGSITGILFRIENIKNIYDLRACIESLEELIPATHASVRRALLVWLRYVITPHKGLQLDIKDTENLSEIRDMLATRIEKWKQEQRAEGREEGRKEGQANMLKKALILKFDSIPDWVERKIDDANPDLIDQWFELVLSSENLEEVFK